MKQRRFITDKYSGGIHEEYDNVDNIYYNIYIPGTNGSDKFASFISTNTEPLLRDVHKYYVTVVKFSIPTDAIPMFIFKIQTNQADINLGVYSFSMSDGVNTLQQFLEFYPVVTVGKIPTSPVGSSQELIPYYYIYDVFHFIQIMNTALQTLFTNFSIAFGLPPGLTDAPYIIYSNVTKTITIIVQKAFITSGFLLYADDILFQFFIGFQTIFNGYNAPLGTVFQFNFVLQPNDDNFYYPDGVVSPPSEFLQYTQQQSALEYWVSFKSIIFATSLIPIQGEYYPTTNTVLSSEDNSGIRNTYKILIDFTPDFQDGFYGQILNYYATNYRLINLLSHGDLRKIDLQVFWADKENHLFPFIIGSQGQLSIKLLFVRKSLYLYSN